MKYVHVVLLLLLNISAYGQSFQEMTDSLVALIPSVNEPMDRVDLLNDISYSYRRIDGGKVLEYANKALVEARKVDYIRGQAIAFKNKGIAHIKLSSPKDSAIYYHQESIKLAEQCKDYYTQAACNNNIAISYTRSNRIITGIEYYLKGIEIFDQHIQEDSRLKALMLANVAESFFYQGEYERALSYVARAFEMAKKNDYRSIISIYANDYGKILSKLGKIEEARAIFKEGLTVSKQFKDEVSFSFTLAHLANLEFEEGKYQEAEAYAKEAYDFTHDRSIQDAKAISQLVLAKIEKHRNNGTKAIEYCLSILAENSDKDFVIFQQEARLLVSSCYEEKQLLAKALFYLREYEAVNNKTKAFEKASVFAELEAKYQIREKEKAITFLSKEKAIRDRYINWLILLCSIAVIASVFVVLLLFRNKKKNKIIEGKHAELEKYIETNLQLENFAYIASHDLRTPLRNIISFSQILTMKLSKKFDSEELKNFDFIIQSTKEMSALIDDLFEYSKINSEKNQLGTVYVDRLIENVVQENQASLSGQEVELFTDLEVKVIEADETKIKQVFHHLISNGIKFRKAQSPTVFHISSWVKDGEVIFKVKDNGIGIEESYFEKIFLVFKKLHQKADYSGSGIGLAICKKVLELHQGKIWVTSTVGEGSEFYFSLPYKKIQVREKKKSLALTTMSFH